MADTYVRRYSHQEDRWITSSMVDALQRLQEVKPRGKDKESGIAAAYHAAFGGMVILNPHDHHTHIMLTGQLLALRLWKRLHWDGAPL